MHGIYMNMTISYRIYGHLCVIPHKKDAEKGRIRDRLITKYLGFKSERSAWGGRSRYTLLHPENLFHRRDSANSAYLGHLGAPRDRMFYLSVSPSLSAPLGPTHRAALSRVEVIKTSLGKDVWVSHSHCGFPLMKR